MLEEKDAEITAKSATIKELEDYKDSVAKRKAAREHSTSELSVEPELPANLVHKYVTWVPKVIEEIKQNMLRIKEDVNAYKYKYGQLKAELSTCENQLNNIENNLKWNRDNKTPRTKIEKIEKERNAKSGKVEEIKNKMKDCLAGEKASIAQYERDQNKLTEFWRLYTTYIPLMDHNEKYEAALISMDKKHHKMVNEYFAPPAPEPLPKTPIQKRKSLPTGDSVKFIESLDDEIEPDNVSILSTQSMQPIGVKTSDKHISPIKTKASKLRKEEGTKKRNEPTQKEKDDAYLEKASRMKSKLDKDGNVKVIYRSTPTKSPASSTKSTTSSKSKKSPK